MYDDRVEITNIGVLPPGWTPEQLLRDHPSVPGNELVANAFHVRELVERWGRGTQDIVEWCRRAGHPAPEFFQTLGHVGVRFIPRVPLSPPTVMLPASDTEQTEWLTPRQHRILTLLEAGSVSLREIMLRLGLAPETRWSVREDLKTLRNHGLIKSRGTGRGAVWSLAGRNGGER